MEELPYPATNANLTSIVKLHAFLESGKDIGNIIKEI